jgi:flavin-dependent dehydrogenase
LPTGTEILLSIDNIYFLGDAAGLIHPFTGEGIYYAL